MSRLGTVLLALLLATVVVACDDEPAADDPASVSTVSPGSTSTGTTDEDCDRIVPPSTVSTLGWSSGGDATYSVLGCERRADQGYLKVRALAVVGPVLDEFDARCAELDTFPDPSSSTEEPSTGLIVTWLGDDVTACAVEPDNDIGLSKVLLVTPSDQLVELWVAALETTEQARVRTALAELAGAATTEL